MSPFRYLLFAAFGSATRATTACRGLSDSRQNLPLTRNGLTGRSLVRLPYISSLAYCRKPCQLLRHQTAAGNAVSVAVLEPTTRSLGLHPYAKKQHQYDENCKAEFLHSLLTSLGPAALPSSAPPAALPSYSANHLPTYASWSEALRCLHDGQPAF